MPLLLSPPLIYRAFGDRLTYSVTGTGLSSATYTWQIKRSVFDADADAVLTLTPTYSGTDTAGAIAVVIQPVDLAFANPVAIERYWATLALTPANGDPPIVIDNGELIISPETAFREVP